MTGRELIEWIHKNDAEDLECVVQYRDSGGDYRGGELIEFPMLANYRCDPDGHPYDVEINYTCGLARNCIVF